MSEKRKAWVIVQPGGRPVSWGGAYYKRTEAMKQACKGLMGWAEYDRLGFDSERWKVLRKQGFRIVRATVEIDDAD